jgi:hypothetical protein
MGRSFRRSAFVKQLRISQSRGSGSAGSTWCCAAFAHTGVCCKGRHVRQEPLHSFAQFCCLPTQLQACEDGKHVSQTV